MAIVKLSVATMGLRGGRTNLAVATLGWRGASALESIINLLAGYRGTHALLAMFHVEQILQAGHDAVTTLVAKFDQSEGLSGGQQSEAQLSGMHGSATLDGGHDVVSLTAGSSDQTIELLAGYRHNEDLKAGHGLETSLSAEYDAVQSLEAGTGK